MDFFKGMMYGNKHPMHFKYYINMLSQKNLDINYSSEDYLEYPSMYEVFLKMEDKIDSEDLTFLLMNFFNKSEEEALQSINFYDEKEGIKCEIYTKDTAETKIYQVEEFIKEKNYAIECILRKAD